MTAYRRDGNENGREGARLDGVPRSGTLNGDGRRHLVVACAIVLGALVLRLLYIGETRDVATARYPVGDAAGYMQWAQRIAQGEWVGSEAFYQAPLYPYVLAVWMKCFGSGVGVVRIAQALMGAASVGLMYMGVSRLLDRATGTVAGLMLALYGPALFFDGIVQKASLACLLICAVVALIGWLRTSQRALLAGVLGGVVGLLVLTRENALVWVPVMFVWVWLLGRQWRPGRWMSAVACYILGVVAALAPVAVRNAVVSGEWSVSTFQAGPNFYIGNHRGATGRYVPLVRGHETPTFERRDATALAEAELGRPLSSHEVSDFWMERAVRDIRSDPGGWIGLMIRKMGMVWNAYEVADAESAAVYADSSTALGVLGSVWHVGVLCPLAAVGVVSTWRRRHSLWVLYALIISMAAAVALFYVMARYRYPVALLLIPFGAAGCVELWRSIRAKDAGSVIIRVIAAGLVAIGVNISMHDEQRLDALSWMNAGVALASHGEIEEATSLFRRAVERHPTSAEANNNLAQALAIQGEFAKAIPHYRAALAADASLMGVDFNLGVALERVGDPVEALGHYRRAIVLDPSDADARAAVSRLRG